MSMTPERFQLISEIYHQALRCNPENRDAFLNQQCARDPDLREQVESLLSGGKGAEAQLLSMAMNEAVRRLSEETPRQLESLPKQTTRPLVDLSGERSHSLVGQTLDHYQILSFVGAGGMGEVYRARDIKLGREVAIKLLLRSFSSANEELRFEREARAASALNHPNILTIHEIEEVDDHRFMVCEFIEGETLRQRLAKGRLPISQAVDVAIQIASALSAAHSAGIVHRDIKAENVMLRRDGLVKVLDFGLAKLNEASITPGTHDQSTVEYFQTHSGVVLGTSSYMSPEQARGLLVDSRSDIWSLGVVFYEMVAGSLPFKGATQSDVLVSVLSGEPEKLISEEASRTKLKQVIDKALKKNRDERYQTAGEFANDLRQLQIDLERKGNKTKGHGQGFPSMLNFGRGAMYALLVGVIVVLGIAAYNLVGRSPAVSRPPALKISPFTTFKGREQQPTFSPDGNQIAFAWTGDKGNNFDIYIKLVNSDGRPLQLTSDPADDIYPAWSPDGQQIAFVRHVGPDISIFTVPVLGGPERKLYSGTSAFFSLYEFGNALSWSPDGKYLAFSGQPNRQQPNRIFLLSLETLEARELTNPPEGFLGDSTPSISPDGKLLAFVRGASSRDVEVYVMPVSGGEPKRLTFDNRSGRSLAWTADSQSIVFSSWFLGGLRLWKVPASGGTPTQLDVGGEFASTLAISRQGDRLAYSQELRDTNIWRIDLRGAPGKPTAPIELISSTRQDYSPQYSSNGKKIVFTSGRTGNNEIWICDSDGSNPAPLTSVRGSDVGSPKWSPDDRQVAFDSLEPGHRDIYVIKVDGGKARRLTGDKSDNVRPSWSRDGRWIYFGSNRTGDWQLWKAPAEGGQPVQVTKQGGREGVESLDGKFVFYSKGFGVSGIWKVPTEGGEETFVIDGVFQGFWSLLDKGIYFVDPNAMPHAAIEFFDFATGRTRKIGEIDKELQLVYPSVAVSPDGQSLLYVQTDSFESDIMLVEGFH